MFEKSTAIYSKSRTPDFLAFFSYLLKIIVDGNRNIHSLNVKYT